MKGSSYALIAIMITMLVIIGLSLGMEYFKSKLLPLVIASAVFILAAIRLKRELKANDEPETTVSGSEKDERGEAVTDWRQYLLIIAWTVGFFLAVFTLGFFIAIPLFILSYMKRHGMGWFVAITFAIITTAVIYGVFEVVFNIDLYRGLIFGARL